MSKFSAVISLCLNVLHEYFNRYIQLFRSIQLFLDLYPTTFLNTSENRSFRVLAMYIKRTYK